MLARKVKEKMFHVNKKVSYVFRNGFSLFLILLACENFVTDCGCWAKFCGDICRLAAASSLAPLENGLKRFGAWGSSSACLGGVLDVVRRIRFGFLARFLLRIRRSRLFSLKFRGLLDDFVVVVVVVPCVVVVVGCCCCNTGEKFCVNWLSKSRFSLPNELSKLSKFCFATFRGAGCGNKLTVNCCLSDSSCSWLKLDKMSAASPGIELVPAGDTEGIRTGGVRDKNVCWPLSCGGGSVRDGRVPLNTSVRDGRLPLNTWGWRSNMDGRLNTCRPSQLRFERLSLVEVLDKQRFESARTWTVQGSCFKKHFCCLLENQQIADSFRNPA